MIFRNVIPFLSHVLQGNQEPKWNSISSHVYQRGKPFFSYFHKRHQAFWVGGSFNNWILNIGFRQVESKGRISSIFNNVIVTLTI